MAALCSVRVGLFALQSSPSRPSNSVRRVPRLFYPRRGVDSAHVAVFAVIQGHILGPGTATLRRTLTPCHAQGTWNGRLRASAEHDRTRHVERAERSERGVADAPCDIDIAKARL